MNRKIWWWLFALASCGQGEQAQLSRQLGDELPVCRQKATLELCFLRFMDIASIRNPRNASYVDKVSNEEAPGRDWAVLVKFQNLGKSPIRFTLIDSMLWENNYFFMPKEDSLGENRIYDYIATYHPFARIDTLNKGEDAYYYIPMVDAPEFELTTWLDIEEKVDGEFQLPLTMTIYRLDSTRTHYKIELK
jgi:hypothetical protein